MNREKIKAQLIIDEGFRTAVYRDSIGFLTVGVGHLVLPSDGLILGDTLTYERVMDLLEHDIVHAECGCRALVKSFDQLPEQVQDVLVNMCFNLGAEGLKEFKRFLTAIAEHSFAIAADEMEHSIWYKQVGARARRLADIIRKSL